MKTQPETTFAREISDRVRVIACLDRLPNMAHSDAEAETFSSSEWSKIKKISGTGEGDVAVVVWGGEEDVDTAVKEIAIRAREATEGVPDETRQALPDGTNGFERILPGPNRMYPDTDLPPIAITEDRIERIRSMMAEPPWERRKRYEDMGLDAETARRLSISPHRDAFDEAVSGADYGPSVIAGTFLDLPGRLRRREGIGACGSEVLAGTIIEASRRGLPASSIEVLARRHQRHVA